MQSLFGSKVDRARLTLFNPITATSDALIGCTVVDVSLEEGVEFRLDFSNGAQMRMSLRDEDDVVYEAGIIGFQDGTIEDLG